MYAKQPPASRRLAQLPQKYADGGMVARMKSADAGPAMFGARGLSQLRDLIPKMQAMGYPQQAPVAAAPAAADPRAAQLQAMIPQVEAMGYKQQPQRLADGGFVSAAKRMMGLTPTDPAQAAALAEYKANAAREKAAAKAGAASAPAPQAAITEYTGMSATERRMKAQGLADGGLIRGPGTGTSDSIPDEMEPGTFIMPADSTQALGLDDEQDEEQGEGKKVPVLVSNGEYELPPERVQAIGAAVLEALKDSTHEATEAQEEGRAAQKLASGGMVENDVTRVGNSYSGGNVGGDVSINGQTGGGTVSTSSWTKPAAPAAPVPAPAPTPATATQPAAAPAPAAPAPMGWAERNAQRSNQVTASSIVDSPERRAAQAALAPAPMAAPAPAAPTAAQRFGTLPGMTPPPQRYADGGTVKDEERAVFGLYPQLADSQRTTYAAAEKLRSGVVASGPSTFAPALKPAPIAPPAIRGGGDGRRMNAQQDPRSMVYAGRPQTTGTAAAAPAPVAAPEPAQAEAAATMAPAALASGAVSARDDGAASTASRRGAADALAQMPNAPPPLAAPTVRNSTNDWAARKALENAATAASSITANGGAWDKTGAGDSQAQAAYKAALATDQTLQNAQPGLDAEAMRQNASLQRETIQQQGSTARDAERNAISRDELGLRKTAAGFQNRAAARMESLGNVLLDPNATPEQRKVAQRSLSALSDKTAADRMQVVNLPDTDNGQGQVLKGGQALVRTLEDGTVEQVPIGGQQQKAALPPGMTKQVGTSNGRPVYEDAKGNRYVG